VNTLRCHSGALAKRANPESRNATNPDVMDSGFTRFARAPE
jgi:hypothetical protein